MTVTIDVEVREPESEALNFTVQGENRAEAVAKLGKLLGVGQGGGDDQPDRADELEDAEGHPGLARQRTKGRHTFADSVEQEDLHDARRCVEERGEDLQDP